MQGKHRKSPPRSGLPLGLIASLTWAVISVLAFTLDPTLEPSTSTSVLTSYVQPLRIGYGSAYLTSSFWDGGEAGRLRWVRQEADGRRKTEQGRPVKPPPPHEPAPFGETADWSAIAACESSGRWDTQTGNGFWGGLQFLPETWFAYGGAPFDGEGPFPYSAAEQIAVAERVLAAQGPSAWPNCFRWK